MREPSVAEPVVHFGARFFRGLFLLVFVGLVVSAGVVLLTTNPGRLTVLFRFPPEYAIAAALLALLPWLANSVRNWMWARFFGVRLSFAEAFRISVAVELGSALTPTATGGGYIKLAMLTRHGMPVGTAASLMTLGTVEEAIFFALALPLAFTMADAWLLEGVRDSIISAFGRNARGVFSVVIPGLLLVACAGLLLRRTRLLSKVNAKVLHAVAAIKSTFSAFVGAYLLILRSGKRLLLTSILLAAVGIAGRFAVVSVVMAGLGEETRPILFGALQWVVLTIAAFVPTPGGAGAAETAFYFVYKDFINADMFVLVAASWRFFTFYFVIAAGALAFVLVSARRAPRRRAGSTDERKAPVMTPPTAAAAPNLFAGLPGRILVASDLHLGDIHRAKSRRRAGQAWSADAAFANWLSDFSGSAESGALLVLNGDTFDFTRVTRVPASDEEFGAWHSRLPEWLRSLAHPRSITRREQRFGLDTDAYKSVWKLHVIIEGHAPVFSALADWVARGGRLLFVTGNHDLELHWPEVRATIEEELEKRGRSARPVNHTFRSRIHFAHERVTVGNVWIEHGHRWERMTVVDGPPIVVEDKAVLNVPRGAHLNRYLINWFERVHSALGSGLARVLCGALAVLLGVFFVIAPAHAGVLSGALRTPLRAALLAALALPPIAAVTVLSIRALAERWITGSSTARVLSGAQSILAHSFDARHGDAPAYAVLGHSHVQEAHLLRARNGVGYYLNPGTWQPHTKYESRSPISRSSYRFIRLDLCGAASYHHTAMVWDDASRAAHVAPLREANSIGECRCATWESAASLPQFATA